MSEKILLLMEAVGCFLRGYWVLVAVHVAQAHVVDLGVSADVQNAGG